MHCTVYTITTCCNGFSITPLQRMPGCSGLAQYARRRLLHPASSEGRRGRLHLGLQGADVTGTVMVLPPRHRHPPHDTAATDAKEIARHLSASMALAKLHILIHVIHPWVNHAATVGAAKHAAAGQRVHQALQVHLALVEHGRPAMRSGGHRRAHEAPKHGRAAVRARVIRAHLRRLLQQRRRGHLLQHHGLVVVHPARSNLVVTAGKAPSAAEKHRS